MDILSLLCINYYKLRHEKKFSLISSFKFIFCSSFFFFIIVVVLFLFLFWARKRGGEETIHSSLTLGQLLNSNRLLEQNISVLVYCYVHITITIISSYFIVHTIQLVKINL
jgi:hypothetical protein